MRKLWKPQIVGIAAVILSIVIIWGANAFLETTSCDNKVFQKISSPNSRYIAQYYERGCGATVDFNRQVKVVDTQDPLNSLKKWLHASLKGIHDALYGLDGTVFTIDGKQSVKIRWKNPNTLVITYPKLANIYIQDEQWQDVMIVYETQDGVQ